MSEEKFQKLETEVRQLIKVSQQLKEVNEDLSTKNSTLRKENKDLEESLDKAKKGISQIKSNAKYVEPPPKPTLEYNVAVTKNNIARNVMFIYSII